MSAARKRRRMRDNAIAPGHNYGAALERFLADNPPTPGRLMRVETLHDDWCGIFKGGPCNCEPTVRLAASDRN
jgi:hypothetical protein